MRKIYHCHAATDTDNINIISYQFDVELGV